MNEITDEQRIARVLEGLREARPAEGLEQRMLRAVRERAPGVIHAQRAGHWSMFPYGSAIAAAVLVGMLVLGSIHRQTRHGEPRRNATDNTRRAEPTIAPGSASPVHLAALPPLAYPHPGTAADPRAKWLRASSARLRPKPAADLFAGGNHPAPEAPLTDEERLLLRIAHRGAPEQFAVLNPDARDAQARSDKADFRKFFGPTPTGDSE